MEYNFRKKMKKNHKILFKGENKVLQFPLIETDTWDFLFTLINIKFSENISYWYLILIIQSIIINSI